MTVSTRPRTGGAREAPRHEIAGSLAPSAQQALWGFESSAALDSRLCRQFAADAIGGLEGSWSPERGVNDVLRPGRSVFDSLIGGYGASRCLTGSGPAATTAWRSDSEATRAHDVSILIAPGARLG